MRKKARRPSWSRDLRHMVGFRADTKTRERLRALAERERRPAAELCRMAVERLLEESEAKP